MRARRLVAAWIGAFLVGGTVAAAAPLASNEVPEPLRPWVDWVLRGHERERCPFSTSGPDDRRCVWPSRLDLDLDDSGGRFRQDLLVAARSFVPLPGDRDRWPEEVTVDGRQATVVEHEGSPAVELDVGSHRIAGRFVWSRVPELLPIPAATGLLSLRLRGEAVPFPNRDPRNQLWLGRRAVDAAEESRLDVVVHRQVIDEIPLQLVTRVKLQVSGKSREVLLSRAVPEGFVPMSLQSPLPARVEPDGRIRAQVRPGTWELVLVARHLGPAAGLSLPPVEGPWDPEEVWVFEARPGLRVVTVEGVPSIDPQQTELPQEWRSLPAYPMKPGSVLRLVERRRGDSEPAADRLTLARTLWLDFDGGGYTLRDHLSGELHRSWRLEMRDPVELGRVAVGGEDQFITRLDEDGEAGVEVRQESLQVEAESRIEEPRREIPAVGWDHDFQQVGATLQLPPGWNLFHATGPDDVSPTWIGRWTLLDLFLVLVLSLAIGAVWGRPWGLLAIVTLGLVHPEGGASPTIWIAVVALQALVVVLPDGKPLRFLRAVRLAVLVALVLGSLAFMIDQARKGLYPALEGPTFAGPWTAAVGGVMSPAPPPAAPEEMSRRGELETLAREGYEMADEARDRAARVLRGKPSFAMEKSAGAYATQDRLTAIDPDAKITTGPGVPRWSWRAVSLSWRGPVDREQTVRLYLISPAANLALAFLRIALLAALLYAVLRVAPKISLPGRRAAAATAVVLAAVLGLSPTPARAAEFPPAEMLDELRGRLLEKPDCLPSCAAVPRLLLEARRERLSLRLEVDAMAEIAIPLPGGEKQWIPERVAIDGAVAEGIALGDDGILWLRVPRGRHQVILEGALPARDAVDLPLPLRPHRVESRVEGWSLAGVRDDGVAQGTLSLVRERAEGEGEPEELEPTALPPFVRVERTIRLGLSREIETRVVRLSPAGTPIVLEVPLLEGEAPTTPELRVERRKAMIEMAPRQGQVAWRSILEPAPSVTLAAPETSSWVETWVLDAAPIWHVETAGIPTILRETRGVRIREWRPWPGEKVTIAVTRPGGVAGPTSTIDHVALELRPGTRTSEATLALDMRSSRGGEHRIGLPEGAELLSVAIDGSAQPIRAQDSTVTLPIRPGSQSIALSWREPRGIDTRLRSSAVDLGAPSVNDDVTIEVPRDRWILLAGGGRLGPAVLFWSVLVIVALGAVALARLGLAPLGIVSWFLLGVGLTQVSIPAAAIVVGWLLVLGWRRREGWKLSAASFDLLQIAIVVWTIAAGFALFSAIEQGLLGSPEMQIRGNGSYAGSLRWTFDRSGAELPQPWVISVPLYVYRLAMLAWALWIARALIGWLRWGWESFSEGELWRKAGLTLRRAKPASPEPPGGAR